MPLQGQEPFEEDLKWLNMAVRRSGNRQRSWMRLPNPSSPWGSSLLMVYTGALALLNLNERVIGPLSQTLIFIPILLWFVCISCLAYVYFPDRFSFNANSPTDIENVTREISRKKSFRLKVGSVLFVAALATSSISMVWLGEQPTKDMKMDGQTILGVAKENVSVLQNLSGLIQEEGIRVIVFTLEPGKSDVSSGQIIDESGCCKGLAG